MNRSPSTGIVLAGALVVMATAGLLPFLLQDTDPPVECPSCGSPVRPKAYPLRSDGGVSLNICCWPRRDEHRSVAVAPEERTSKVDPNWTCTSCDRSWMMHRDQCPESTTPMMIRRARSLLGIVR